MQAERRNPVSKLIVLSFGKIAMAFVLLFLKCYYFFSGNCDFNAVSELRSLKSRLEELESDLRDRDEQIGTLKEQNKSVNGDDSDVVKVSILRYITYCIW